MTSESGMSQFEAEAEVDIAAVEIKNALERTPWWRIRERRRLRSELRKTLQLLTLRDAQSR